MFINDDLLRQVWEFIQSQAVSVNMIQVHKTPAYVPSEQTQEISKAKGESVIARGFDRYSRTFYLIS